MPCCYTSQAHYRMVIHNPRTLSKSERKGMLHRHPLPNVEEVSCEAGYGNREDGVAAAREGGGGKSVRREGKGGGGAHLISPVGGGVPLRERNATSCCLISSPRRLQKLLVTQGKFMSKGTAPLPFFSDPGISSLNLAEVFDLPCLHILSVVVSCSRNMRMSDRYHVRESLGSKPSLSSPSTRLAIRRRSQHISTSSSRLTPWSDLLTEHQRALPLYLSS